jgi:3-oxoacyl-[acyl-carrier protein] reductase
MECFSLCRSGIAAASMKSETKVAVVTGSGRGIGRSTAIALASSGARVVVNVKRNLQEGAETLAMINKMGSDGILVQSDVSTDTGAKELIGQTISRLGKIDILVNNAGVGIAAPLLEIDETLWDKQINTNLKSVFLCSKYACSNMVQRGWGRIVNITSVAGIMGMAELIPYSAAKAGVIGLTKALAAELPAGGITVNAVASGLVDSKMGRSLVGYLGKKQGTTASSDESILRWAALHTLTGRLPDSSEIAAVVKLLTSDEAASITGQVIVIDSGWTMSEARNYQNLSDIPSEGLP